MRLHRHSFFSLVFSLVGRRARITLRASVAAAALAGCSTPSGGGADAGPPDLWYAAADLAEPPDMSADLAPFQPGAHVPMPQIPGRGGPVLGALKLITITFSDDANAAMEESFGDWSVKSPWLATAAEYGVASGAHMSKVRVPMTAPTTVTQTDVVNFLLAKLGDGTLPKPADDASGYLFAVYYPRTTQLSVPDKFFCQQFAGFHGEAKLGMVRFAFAAIGDCPTYISSFTEAENIQRGAAQELIAAATNPFPTTAPAYFTTDTTNPWSYYGGEVSDVCPPRQVFRDSGFLAQRYFSNGAAQAGRDPCVPAPADLVYYNTAVSPAVTQIIPAGMSATFELQGFSAAPTTLWALQASRMAGDFAPTSQLDVANMQNGGRGHLTVTVPAGTPPGKFALIQLLSVHTTTEYHVWPVAVRSQ